MQTTEKKKYCLLLYLNSVCTFDCLPQLYCCTIYTLILYSPTSQTCLKVILYNIGHVWSSDSQITVQHSIQYNYSRGN